MLQGKADWPSPAVVIFDACAEILAAKTLGDSAFVSKDSCVLKIEEAAAILIRGQDADFGAAEDAVAAAGYGFVDGVAKRLGQELQERRRWTPEAWELL